MKLRMPEYYRNFRCIAGKCTDSCCTGWGIYIDDKTAERYRSTGGEFGERLRSGIDFEGGQCFVNDSERRCPFLNGGNLCDIIINMGEDALCDICDRHPRYFEWFGDIIEGGIGLCCEEAARLILSSIGFGTYETEVPERIIDEPDELPDEQYLSFLRSAREKLITLLTDTDVPLGVSLRRLLAYGEQLQFLTDIYEIEKTPEIAENTADFDHIQAAGILSDLEPEDLTHIDYWSDLADYLKTSPDIFEIPPEDEPELRNIAVYFTWRYFMKAVFSGQIYTKIYLAVFGTAVIGAMYRRERETVGNLDLSAKCALAKDFSKLAEYSEDNLYLIYDRSTPE